MTMQQPGANGGAGALVGRVIAGVVAAGAGALFLLAAWVAVGSRFGPAERDLHGYGLIFGTVLAVLSAFVVAAVLPLVFARRIRGRAYAVCMLAFALILVGLIIAVVTA